MKKQRNSNIELLRIVAMFLIVLHHAIVHGGLDKTTIDFYTNTRKINSQEELIRNK